MIRFSTDSFVCFVCFLLFVCVYFWMWSQKFQRGEITTNTHNQIIKLRLAKLQRMYMCNAHAINCISFNSISLNVVDYLCNNICNLYQIKKKSNHDIDKKTHLYRIQSRKKSLKCIHVCVLYAILRLNFANDMWDNTANLTAHTHTLNIRIICYIEREIDINWVGPIYSICICIYLFILF